MTEEPQWTAWKAYLNSLFQTSGIGYEAIKELSLAINVDPSERTYQKLFWRDDMENYRTNKWEPLFPTNTEVDYIKTVKAFEGDHVLKVQHQTNRYCECGIRFGAFKLQKTSFEMKWFHRIRDQYNGYVVQVRCADDANAALRAIIRWTNERDDGTPGWIYTDSIGETKDIPGGTEYLRYETWNYLKIIIDWENGTFYRLVTNLLDIDLSAIRLQTLSHTQGQFLISLAFQVQSGFSLPYPFYVDDVRLYLNEYLET